MPHTLMVGAEGTVNVEGSVECSLVKEVISQYEVRMHPDIEVFLGPAAKRHFPFSSYVSSA